MAKKIEMAVFVLFIILAILIGKNLIYKYTSEKLVRLRKQAEDAKEKNNISEDIAILDGRLRAYQNRSLPTQAPGAFLDRIAQLAKEADVRINAFNPLPIVYTEHYIEMPIKVLLRCDYHQLGHFLSLLESNREFIEIRALNMQKATVINPEQTQLPRIDLTVSTYYLSDE